MSAALAVIALVSAGGTWLARVHAVRRDLLDHPGERRSHTVATPRGGGAGPVVAILVGLVWYVLRTESLSHGLVALVGAVGLVALIGAWDDHRPLRASTRFAVHLVAAAVLTYGFGPWASAWQPALVFVAAVVLINVWNFMDGINGIAATQATLAAAFAAILLSGTFSWAAWCVAVACAAFVPFNFPRARIFMGDVGSGALGMALAGLCALGLRQDATVGTLMLFPLSAFLVDAGLTLLRRALRGERWWEAHTQHLYQALARRYGHTPVTVAYAGWTLLASLIAAIVRSGDTAFIIICAALWYMAGAGLWLLLQAHAARESGALERDR